MANQHDVRKLLPPHLVDNVQDLHVEIDIGLEQVRSFGNPGECRGEHLVVICGEQPRHATPAPRAVPRAVNENKDGHVFLQEHRRQCMYELRSSPRTWFAAEKSTTEFDRRLFRQETTAPSADRFSKFFFAMEAAKLVTSRRAATLQFILFSVRLVHLC